MELDQSYIDKYKEDGYLVIDTQIPSHVFDDIVEFLKDGWNRGQFGGGRVQDAWKHNELIRSLSLNPRILWMLEKLYNRKPLPFQTLNFPKGTQQSVHSDTLHFNTEPFGLLCGIWVALEDVNVNQGPLIFYPKSHKLPEMNFEHIDFRIDNKDEHHKAYKVYSEELESMMNERGLQPQLGVLKKGQAIIWEANLIHGGLFQSNKDLSRYSQVTHYFFEGAKFGNNIGRAKAHWQSTGRFEGRNFKLKNVDYDKVERFIGDDILWGHEGERFNIITSLYNESDSKRFKEYVLALKMNQRNTLINRIYVFYDIRKGGSKWYNFLKSWTSDADGKISVIECYGRPSFADMFSFSNMVGTGKWIVCNGDIVVSSDFAKLMDIDLKGKLLSITRWELISEDDMSIFHLAGRMPNILSQDCWVYEAPLNFPIDLEKVKMGEMLCDSNLNYLFKLNKLPIYNPCLDLRTFHIHFQNARSYSSGDTSNKLFEHSWTGYEDFELIRYDSTAPCVEACRLEDIR
jgi:hypothetical protein